jgi:DNA (cytosine-5)-methyltransferase 1
LQTPLSSPEVKNISVLLTPLECARLMGFETKERKFKISVSDTQAYKQFGNAVVVPVVEFIAAALKPHIESALAKQPTSTLPEQKARHVTRPENTVAAN